MLQMENGLIMRGLDGLTLYAELVKLDNTSCYLIEIKGYRPVTANAIASGALSQLDSAIELAREVGLIAPKLLLDK